MLSIAIWRIIMYIRSYLFILSISISQTLIPHITVENKTDKAVYVAAYCYPVIFGHKGAASREYEPVEIAPRSVQNRISRQRTLSCDRRLLFSYDKNDLADQISEKKMPAGIGSVDIGGTNIGNAFDYFYILEKNGRLNGYNTPAYIALSGEVSSLDHLLQMAAAREVLENSSLVKNNPYKNTPAQLRVGNTLNEKELSYVNQRKQHVKDALQTFLQEELNGNYIPTIATINSGGGTRSMISMLGFHIGAHNTGLLDTVMYDVGLSGGAWFVSLWVKSKKTPSDFKNDMRLFVQKGIIGSDSKVLDSTERDLVAKSILLRAALKQPVTLVNIWGALIASRYLSAYGNDREQVRFSNVVSDADANRYPFPILTAVNAYDVDATEVDRVRMHWYEFTPYEVSGVGNWLHDVHVPTWALGRKFSNGTSTNYTPEYDLGLLMGIWGSAFGFSSERLKEEIMPENPVLKMAFSVVFNMISAGETISEIKDMITSPIAHIVGVPRLTDVLADDRRVGFVHNFTRDMPNALYKDKHKLKMIDAGLAFNLPYPPISGKGARKADIIIIFDASGDLYDSDAPDFRAVIQYAKINNLAFPEVTKTAIDYDKITKSIITIFKDEQNPEVPLVIYLPGIIDRKQIQYDPSIPQTFNTGFSTMKFAYNDAEFNNLSMVTQQNVEQSINAIKEAIRWKIAQRNGLVQKQAGA